MCHLVVIGSIFVVVSVESLGQLVDCLWITGVKTALDFGAGLVSDQG